MNTRTLLRFGVLIVVWLALISLNWQVYAQPRGSPQGMNVAPTSRSHAQGRFTDDQLRNLLPKLSFHAAKRIANKLGVTEIQGKRLNLDKPAGTRYRTEIDNPVGTSSGYRENEPSVAANPANGAIVVAFMHHYLSDADIFPPEPCMAWFSYDGGETFQYFFGSPVPLPAGGDFCSDPVVRFSPDGEYAYYAFLSVDLDSSTSDAVVCKAPGDRPEFIFSCNTPLPSLGQIVDKEWLDVHTFNAEDFGRGVVHVTATEFTTGGACNIIYNRSQDYGDTWSFGTGVYLATSPGCTPVLQGSRPVGAPESNVLACWYNSELDGFRAGVFDIKCRVSGDYGVNWGDEFAALDNRSFELPQYLCPTVGSPPVGLYHRWWGAMFPAIAIDHLRRAHLTVTYDPTSGAGNTECGNVLYRRSLSPPYTAWQAPIVVGSDASARAQGYATVVAQQTEAVQPRIYVAYYGHKNSVIGGFLFPNGRYDLFYRRSLDGGTTFGAPVRVTDVSSTSDYLFIGDYVDSSATARLYHVVWTDRADKLAGIAGILDGEDDVYHDRFP